jgi:signal transduction histidine kinase
MGLRAWRHRVGHSLRWRLVAVFVLLALAITGVFVLGMQRVFKTGWQAYAKPMVADYVDKLAAELGSPPTLARAQALSQRLPMLDLRVQGPQLSYGPPPAPPRLWHHRDDSDSWGLVRHTADGHRLQFGLRAPPRPEGAGPFVWITLLLLLAGVAAAWAWVRRLLAPLQDIGAGAARFGAGDFAQPIAVRRRDELGDLAQRINQMASGLHGMLEAKRALLLAISHELRSPLTRARLNAELVDDSPHRDALLRDLAEMRDLITDLLESERLAQGHAALQREAVHLPTLVREVLDAHFAGAVLTVQADAAMPSIQADAPRLRLLLRNLVGNALRHSAGASLTPELSVHLSTTGQVRIEVRDHGPGVTDDQLQRLAEPFYRTDAARERTTGGVGLGLTLCRLVAQAHGGTLAFEHAHPGLQVVAAWRA